MENRRNVILVSLITAGLLLTANQTVAYKVDTHAYLTQKSYEVFNRTHPNNQIPQELVSFLLDGSRREDDPPRPMNHFYDPVKNRGLTKDFAIDPLPIPGNWLKSKDWAQNSKSQNELTYSSVIATILSSIDAGKIQKYLPTSDFTWNEALRYWIQGDKEMAMFTLGHILHLIQDASVPDHTRNDPHPGDSPYENYTARFTTDSPDYVNALRNALVTPKSLPSLDSYFLEMATYSNNNFYSKDTIGLQSGYNNPSPIQFENDIGSGEVDNHKFNLVYKKSSKGSQILETKNLYSIDDSRVLNDYWSLLSKKSIEYNAGVMDLFFKEAEKNKNNPAFLIKKKSFFGQILELAQNTINSLFGNGSSGGTQIVSIPVTNNNGITASPPAGESTPRNGGNAGNFPGSSGSTKTTAATQAKVSPKITPSPSPGSTSSPQAKITPKVSPTPKVTLKVTPTPKTSQTPKASPSPSVLPNTCVIPSSASPTYSPVLINEVAWMGTAENASNEWIELKNISGSNVNLSRWAVKTKDGSVNNTLPNISITAGGYVLLERTDDDTVIGVKADALFTGTLANTGEQLYLFNSACGLIDAITADKWPAGNASDRKTMERNDSTRSWHTSSVVNGTPRKANSSPSPSSSGGSGGGGISSSPSPSPNPTVSPTASPSPSPSPSPVSNAVEISEIYYNPEGADNGREWIEIQNNDTATVNLQNWKHSEEENSHTFTVVQGSTTLSPGAYAIIAYDANGFLNEFGEFSGTILQSSCPSCSIKNESDTITIYNGDLEIDSVQYNSSWGADETGNSLQEVDGSWCSGSPTPGTDNACGPPEETEPQTNSLTLKYLAGMQDTPEQERDMQRFSPALEATWQGILGENEHYIVEDVTDPDSIKSLGTTDVDYYRFQIGEVGNTYKIRASATNGTAVSAVYEGSIQVPKYITTASFHNQESPTFDMHFSQYPFIPNLYAINEADSGVKLVVFFLNHAPVADGGFHAISEDSRIGDEWSTDMKESSIAVTYKKCNESIITLPVLSLTNSASSCPTNKNYMSYSQIGEDTLHVTFEKERVGTLSANDYITMAYYVLSMSTYGGQSYSLAAIDNTKYYFSE